jgi:hypothetical protein
MAPRSQSPRSRMDRFRYEYGAEPLHLLATLASLAIVAYAFLRIFENPSTGAVLLWLAGAIVFHDFLALPLYSAFLRVAEESTDATVRPRRRGLLTLNHVRVPAALSLLLLLVSLGLVFQLDEQRFQLTTALDTDRYLGNWLLITGVLFALSGLLYALRLRGGRADRPLIGHREPGPPPPPPEPGRALRLASRAVLAVGALLALWVAALVIYGLIASFPF